MTVQQQIGIRKVVYIIAYALERCTVFDISALGVGDLFGYCTEEVGRDIAGM